MTLSLTLSLPTAPVSPLCEIVTISVNIRWDATHLRSSLGSSTSTNRTLLLFFGSSSGIAERGYRRSSSR